MDTVIEKKPYLALKWPLIFSVVLWLVHLYLKFNHLDALTYGVYPLKISGLKGILFSPFIHEGFHHLFNNTIPLLVLGWATFYFYKEVAFKTIGFIWFVGSFWLWIIGRPAYHLGASGLVYGLVTFLFLSGILRKEPRVAGISLLVIFLYGSLIWGLFPIDYNISYEAHLCGAIAGIAMAWLYRKTGIQPQIFVWPEEDEDTHWQTEDEKISESISLKND